MQLSRHFAHVTLLGSIAFVTILGTLAKAETVVTTYVVDTQEERKSTRWTLTEWLRIKERMKMMDLWLAMFSDPQKDRKFRPELNLVYSQNRGTLTLDNGQGEPDTGDLGGYSVKAQFWLTNLISSTTGARTLNIDFGLEGFQKSSSEFEPTSPDDALGTLAAATTSRLRQGRNQHGTANFRLFGDSIQDSSLVVKYGVYRHNNSIPDWAEAGADQVHTGRMLGGELALYFLSFLGVEGSYHHYGPTTASDTDTFGTYYEYLGFIEVSLLRVMFGRYQESWQLVTDKGRDDLVENGLIGGLKLQF